MKRIVLGAFAVVVLSLSCAAQTSLGFVHTTITPSTPYLGDTLSIHTYLRNYGNADFVDSIHFGLRHNGANVNDTSIFPSPYSGFPAPVEHIDSGDSISLHFKVILGASEFSAGVTGVVIWPISINQHFNIHDSLMAQITVAERTGIEEQQLLENKIACLVINRHIHVAAIDAGIDFREIKLYNAAGQLLFSSSQALPIDIPLEEFPAGVAFVQITFGNGQHLSKKVFVPSR